MDATTIQLCKYLVVYPAQLLALLTAAALLMGFRPPKRWCWAITGLGLLAFFLWPHIDIPGGPDLWFFWHAGRDVLAGIDPYHNHYCLNPPTGLPILALLALLPLDDIFVLWTLCTLVGTSLLIYLSRRALAGEPTPTWVLPPEALGVLTAALVISVASRHGIGTGQVALLTAVLLILAIWSQRCERPILAGVLLAIATIKAQTTLPFLLLFCRRKDWPAWPAFACACLGLSLLATPPAELFTRTVECLRNIAHLGTPGHMNDFASPVCYDMIGFNRALFYLGLTDRAVAQTASLVLVLALGAWVSWRVLGSKALPAPAATALVGLYSCAFLYHRFYDLVILALPLVYVAGRACERGPGRWFYCAAGLAILGVLYPRVDTLIAYSYAARPGVSIGLLQALILSHSLWLLLFAMGLLAFAERSRATVASSSRANSAVMKRQSAEPVPALAPEIVCQS